LEGLIEQGVDTAAEGVGRDSVYRTFEAVGDAWSWLLLREAVLHDVRRFSVFQTRLEIARSTLAARLAQLIDGGLLVRTLPAGTSGAEYLLTDSGRDFFECLMMAMAWGDRWYPATNAQSCLLVTHHACGRPLAPHYRCAGCSEVVRAVDVRPQRPEVRLGSSRMPGQRHRAPSFDLLERAGTCSIARTLAVMGDWWSGMVIRESFYGVHRFDELQSNLGIATNVLSARLRHLVEYGVLDRSVYQHRPTRHEYHLTGKGLDLYPVPLAILSWGDRWRSPDGPPIPLLHHPCQQRLRPILTCGGCDTPAGRADALIHDHRS
jgi:DNA-binding HxlR family transcriptional regulator